MIVGSAVGAPVDGVTVLTTVGNLVGLNVGISKGALVGVRSCWSETRFNSWCTGRIK